MRIFINELKKLWNWKLLAIIAALAALTWFALLQGGLDSFTSMTTHGIYGKYQNEMFDLYGETLSPDELADYDIPGKLDAVYAEGDAIIAENPVYTKYGVYDFAGYLEYTSNRAYVKIGDLFVATMQNGEIVSDEDEQEMQTHLWGGSGAPVDDWYNSPMGKYHSLTALQHSYEDYPEYIVPFIKSDGRPVVVRVAKEMYEANEPSLVRYDLCNSFSGYAAIAGVFAILAVLLLVAPPLTNDRARMIVLLQYSSRIGRKIMRYQFAATLVSALIVSLVLITAAYVPFIANDAAKFWDAQSAMSFNAYVNGGVLCNVTFGQYVLILAAVSVACSVAAACVAFVFARFSSNVVTLMIKAVPGGAAVAAIAALSLGRAFTPDNIIFTQVFRGRFDMPEVWTCAALAVIGVVGAAVVVRRERRVDVA
ncbi:hypothetical protein FACS1894202_01660 [Clostridia bacterium]|nr:hypothetical protein FACS1894202_01660 [Clostridia bacterium]